MRTVLEAVQEIKEALKIGDDIDDDKIIALVNPDGLTAQFGQPFCTKVLFS